MAAAVTSSSERPRLLATIIGVDVYDREGVPDLSGAARDARLVYDALRRTRLESTRVEGRLLVSGGDLRPTRAAIFDALRAVAAESRPSDTVLIHFSGHGILSEGRVHVVPSDGDPNDPATLVAVEDAQDLFAKSPCPRRAFFLDTCQEVVEGEPAAGEDGQPALSEARRARPYRTRGSATRAFVEALPASRPAWVLMSSCGPGELSLESADLDYHGIFSYYVALGLRGEADLDGDGTVGLGELAQYVADKVPREASLCSRGLLTQTPQLVCRGQISSMTDEGAAQGDAAAVHRRRFTPPPGLGRQWGQALRGAWPFEALGAWSWLVRGSMVMYGLIMGLDVLLSFWPPTWASLAAAGGVAAASVVLWWLMVGLGVASTLMRYHHGGYVNGAVLLAWHGLVFAGAAILGLSAISASELIRFGVQLFVAISVMVVYGFNIVHTLLSLLDLERRKEEAALRGFFGELDRGLVRAELPVSIACETFHPKVYLASWVVVTLPLVAHMAWVLWKGNPAGREGLVFLRDAALWVLVTWQVSGYNAMYTQIRRKHPMRASA